jgi:hypothetical protein
MGLHGILDNLNVRAIDTALMLLALVVFVGVAVWAYTRPQRQIDEQAQLWRDDE